MVGPLRTLPYKKTLPDGDLLRRSVFAMPPPIYYAVNPSFRYACKTKGK